MKNFKNKQSGFTLIELLVVISIVGVLSSIVLTSLTTARAKARDSVRLADLTQLRQILEVYYQANGHYPSTCPGGATTCWQAGGQPIPEYRSVCTHGTGANGYIPGLVPTYYTVLPSDPNPVAGATCFDYIYRSNGTHYALIANVTLEEIRVSDPASPTPTYTNFYWAGGNFDPGGGNLYPKSLLVTNKHEVNGLPAVCSDPGTYLARNHTSLITYPSCW